MTLLVERVVELMVDVALEDCVQDRVEVHGRVRVDAVQGPVVASEQDTDKPMDPHWPLQHKLQAEEQKGSADVFDDEVDEVDVEGVQAPSRLGWLVVELVEVVPLRRVEARVQRRQEEDVAEREQQVEWYKDREPEGERQGGWRKVHEGGLVHGKVGEHRRGGGLKDKAVRFGWKRSPLAVRHPIRENPEI